MAELLVTLVVLRPVGATPELDEAAVAETIRNPHRFDHLKLWRRSTWELTRWNTEDTLGFAISCGVTLAIIALFVGILKLVAL